MPAAAAFLSRWGVTAGRFIWSLLGSSKFQAGAFLSWLAFDDDDNTSGTAGAVMGLGIALVALVGFLAYAGGKRILKNV
jgi:hypothetical protein